MSRKKKWSATRRAWWEANIIFRWRYLEYHDTECWMVLYRKRMNDAACARRHMGYCKNFPDIAAEFRANMEGAFYDAMLYKEAAMNNGE